jgi:phosphopantothenoylcysteine decarboxylase
VRNILLGLTGSVASIKAKQLHAALSAIGDVKIIATKTSQHFVGDLKCLTDEDEWSSWKKMGDPVLHIELRRWASCLVIAPLSANTLAKLVHGICDNLLTCVFRAWDHRRPVVLAPAMNTFMWDNEPTREQIKKMRSGWRCRIVEPVEKRLACDDVGMGAMAPIQQIAQIVEASCRWHFPLVRCTGVPINHHPGAFGFHRRKNHHTGVDLYCENGSIVRAVEPGTVVHVGIFTGPKVGHPWWEETWGIMVEGPSGVVNYGEITPLDKIKVGYELNRGEDIGKVKRVLFEDKFRPDIPGHSTSMLHLELYKHGTRDFADWHDVSKNPQLIDPTKELLDAAGAPTITLTWDNIERKTVG